MSQPQPIAVTDLDLPQLVDVRRQLDEELNHLTSSFSQLKQAQAKFKSCLENVAEVTPSNKGKTILVPLTNSLYVPGRLSDLEHVVVDVGTGYYVKKTRAEAAAYYEAKIEFVRKNLESLQETIQTKQDNMNYLVNVMQLKSQQQRTAPAPSSSSS